jgi:DNA-binding ferritin-like protein
MYGLVTDGRTTLLQATADVLTEITRAAGKDLWFLEAHMQA